MSDAVFAMTWPLNSGGKRNGDRRLGTARRPSRGRPVTPDRQQVPPHEVPRPGIGGGRDPLTPSPRLPERRTMTPHRRSPPSRTTAVRYIAFWKPYGVLSQFTPEAGHP